MDNPKKEKSRKFFIDSSIKKFVSLSKIQTDTIKIYWDVPDNVTQLYDLMLGILNNMQVD